MARPKEENGVRLQVLVSEKFRDEMENTILDARYKKMQDGYRRILELGVAELKKESARK
jgi:hypothetical protein